jgi:hypothetical protein
MGRNQAGRNAPWFVSNFTTAAGILAEKSAGGASTVQGRRTQYRLRGYSVSGSTAIAVSSTPLKLRLGPSSDGPFTSHQIANEPGAGMIGAANIMGIEAGYIAIQSTVAHADGGLSVMLWGD